MRCHAYALSWFGRIEYVESVSAMREDHLVGKETRDRLARNEYLKVLRKKRIRGDLRIDRIIDEGIGSDDKRLR